MLKKIIIILVVISLIMIAVVITSYGDKPVTYKEIKIEKGQTLWNIAASYNNTGSDPRKLVYQIKKINDINDSILQPGQIIKIPVCKKG